MKSIILTIAVAFAGVAQAIPTYWAAAYTEAATADTSGGEATSAYSGYYCSTAQANYLFGGDTVDYLTKYFSANYETGVQALKDASAPGAGSVGKLGRSLVEFDHGQYALNSTYGDSLKTYGYGFLAVLLYSTDTAWEFRVMSGDAAEMANGNAYFNDSDPTATGTAGDWTTVPEPTGGLLLLLGVAGLALRRRP